MYIYIRSMSEAQSKIYDKLTDRSEQIDQHIIRILLFPDSRYVDHWMHEIWASLHTVDRLKGKNTWPKEKFIKKCLSTHNDILDVYTEVVKDIESSLIPNDVPAVCILYSIEAYQDWIARELSINGYVTQAAVKAKLSDIIRKYTNGGIE